MALKTFVKISDVSNLSDARYCAGMGVDLLGFRLDPDDPHSIDAAKFKNITEWIAGVGFAGEFYQSNSEVIVDIAKKYNLSYLQINPLNLTQIVTDLKIPLIIDLILNNHSSIEGLTEYMQKSTPHVEFFLISAENDEIAASRLPDILKLSEEFPILLGCGINKDNITQLLESSQIKGIALRGSRELHPGFKDYDELAEILEEIEQE
jgi:phosphoribosylanthranilate isomerase